MSELQVRKLNPNDDQLVKDFLTIEGSAPIYYSIEYREFLKSILKNSSDHYLGAFLDNRIAGILPIFSMKNPELGVVVNSLPFYGSHGAPIVASKIENQDISQSDINDALLTEYSSYLESVEASSSTLIQNPFGRTTFNPREGLRTYRDDRIGQYIDLTKFSGFTEKSEDLSAGLMASFHSKTRNLVRKSQKLGVEVFQDNSEDAWSFLIKTHLENMNAIGGKAKPKSVFESIKYHFSENLQLWSAFHENKRIGALLLLKFNKIVEYFTPVISEDYRSYQPMSAIIYKALEHSVREGADKWNWGGTWRSQESVYHFKKRWGTTDIPYSYSVQLIDESFLNLSPQTLNSSFPFYYVLPFKELNA